MADTFNAYHKWLGIPPKDQPPNLYRLLGVELFESDADVISAAADQRMVYLRSFQSSKQGAAAEALLNEISAARVCLLSPEKREAYDRQLRAKTSTLPAPRPLTPGAVTHEQALANVRTSSVAGPTPAAVQKQEVPLAAVPLPGAPAKPASKLPPPLPGSPPPRKSGPLPMATYAPTTSSAAPSATPTKFEKPPGLAKPPSRSIPPPAISLPPNRNILGEFFALLPQRLWWVVVFLFKLPGRIAYRLLRGADAGLRRAVGDENVILYNFLRVVIPVVLTISLVVGTIFGVRWAAPQVVAAVRLRTMAQTPRAPIVQEFVMNGVDDAAPDLSVPSPFIPPEVSPGPTATLISTNDKTNGLRNAPAYKPIDAANAFDAARFVESHLDAIIDPATSNEAKRTQGFEYRQAIQELAHTITFADDLPLATRNELAALAARANDTPAKRAFHATHTSNDLKLPGPDLPGVMVCGKLISKSPHNSLFETHIDIGTSHTQVVSVLSDREIAQALSNGHDVVVFGAIIDKPVDRIGGYAGPPKSVIWSKHVFAAPPITSDTVANVPVTTGGRPAVAPPVEEEVAVVARTTPTEDLYALARFATALQNSGQSLVVPMSHPQFSNWLATGFLKRERMRSWGPEQAEGPPNTTSFGDMATAWASATRDDQIEWLEVYYAETITPRQVNVYETYCPGALMAISAIRGTAEVELWRGDDPIGRGVQGGVAIVKVDHAFPTNRLRIYLNSPAVAGWNEIDAVGIVDSHGRTHWAAAVVASSSYAGEDHPQFVIDGVALVQHFNADPKLRKWMLQESRGTPRRVNGLGPRLREPGSE